MYVGSLTLWLLDGLRVVFSWWVGGWSLVGWIGEWSLVGSRFSWYSLHGGAAHMRGSASP